MHELVTCSKREDGIRMNVAKLVPAVPHENR